MWTYVHVCVDGDQAWSFTHAGLEPYYWTTPLAKQKYELIPDIWNARGAQQILSPKSNGKQAKVSKTTISVFWNSPELYKQLRSMYSRKTTVPVVSHRAAPGSSPPSSVPGQPWRIWPDMTVEKPHTQEGCANNREGQQNKQEASQTFKMGI